MKQSIRGTLLPKLREAGFELAEDDHTVELRYKGKPVATFSAIGTTALEIHKEANKWLKEHLQK